MSVVVRALADGDAEWLRRQRARAQWLSRRHCRSPEEVVRHLLAVQSQDLRSARLALRARGSGFSAADVNRALGDGLLVIGWLLRGTLHLVHRDDYPWLLALTAPVAAAANRRRLAQEGVAEGDLDRAVRVIDRALSKSGPLSRAELGERLAAHGIPTTGQALPHLLMLAALRGVTVLGPLRDGAPAFVPARERLAGVLPVRRPPRGELLVDLARRYLSSHGPAAPADLAAWSGLPLREVRAGLSGLAGDLREDGTGRVGLAGGWAPAQPQPCRLLPAFDPFLFGWKDRSFAVAEQFAARVQPGGGMFRAVVLRDGMAAGTWSARREGVRIRLSVAAFPDSGALPAPGTGPYSGLGLDPCTWTGGATGTSELGAELADVARFEGLTPVFSRPPV